MRDFWKSFWPHRWPVGVVFGGVALAMLATELGANALVGFWLGSITMGWAGFLASKPAPAVQAVPPEDAAVLLWAAELRICWEDSKPSEQYYDALRELCFAVRTRLAVRRTKGLS